MNMLPTAILVLLLMLITCQSDLLHAVSPAFFPLFGCNAPFSQTLIAHVSIWSVVFLPCPSHGNALPCIVRHKPSCMKAESKPQLHA